MRGRTRTIVPYAAQGSKRLCPHCGGHVPNPDYEREKALRLEGICPDCRTPNDTPEFWRCTHCRAKRAGRMAMRRDQAVERIE